MARTKTVETEFTELSTTNRTRIGFSVIVPTYSRPGQLLECIRSVGNQTLPPNELIIVNDGEIPEELRSEFRSEPDDSVELSIIGSDPTRTPGASTARNTWLSVAQSPIVVFLDDDTVLASTYLERLYALYELHDSPELAGIGGTHLGPDGGRSRALYDLDVVFDTIFYQGTRKWKINAAGFSVRSYDPGRPPETVTEADWLTGSNMSYKRDVLTSYPFPQWEPGREPGEDLLIGWHLKRDGYHCLVDPKLSLEHEREEDGTVRASVRIGRYRVRTFRRLGKNRYAPLFLWALVGSALREFVKPVFVGQRRRYYAQGVFSLVGAIFQLLLLDRLRDLFR